MLLFFALYGLQSQLLTIPKSDAKSFKASILSGVFGFSIFHGQSLTSGGSDGGTGGEAGHLKERRVIRMKLKSSSGWSSATSTPLKPWKAAPLCNLLPHKNKRTLKSGTVSGSGHYL